MNTKQRLSNDLLNDSEIMTEKRFVKLYEEEITKIDEQISDLKKLDEKDFDARADVEESARTYYRAFAREFYDVCEGRLSDEEFFNLWEREEELRTGLNSINSLEGEQKQLDKELAHANEEELITGQKLLEAQGKKKNKRALFISFLIMAAGIFAVTGFYIYHFEISPRQYMWQLTAVSVLILVFVVILFRGQKKASDQLKLLEMMSTHKTHTGKRLEDDKREIGNDLKFYYEKFEIIFSYISSEQWKLFDFCGKVSARLRISEKLLEAADDLEQLLEKNQWKTSGFWMYHPKVLYDLIKRKDYLRTLDARRDLCAKQLAYHEQILEGITHDDPENIE